MEQHELNGIKAEYYKHTESILLTNGPIAYGFYEDPHLLGASRRKKVTVEGSGKLLRIYIEGIDGYVDVNLQDITDRAVEILTR